MNLFLGIFNFLPIPPLDGSAIVERLLPEKWLPRWYQFRQFGFLILFALVFYTGIVGTILNPFLDRLYNFVLGISSAKHRVQRFFGSLRPRPVDAADVAFVDSHSRPPSSRYGTRCRAPTRRNRSRTARDTARDLGFRRRRHVARGRARCTTSARPTRTSGRSAGGCDRGRGRRQPRPGSPLWRSDRTVVSHDDLGAERLRAAGARPEAAAWAEAHHRRELWTRTGIPSEYLRSPERRRRGVNRVTFSADTPGVRSSAPENYFVTFDPDPGAVPPSARGRKHGRAADGSGRRRPRRQRRHKRVNGRSGGHDRPPRRARDLVRVGVKPAGWSERHDQRVHRSRTRRRAGRERWSVA